MSFNRISFIFLLILSFNTHTMEERHTKGSHKSLTVTQSINLSEEFRLKYKKYFKILREHQLESSFKNYLTSCFEYLSLEMLKDILKIVDIANKRSQVDSYLIQRKINQFNKVAFCDNPFTLIHLFQIASPKFLGKFEVFLKQKQKLYNQALSPRKSKDDQTKYTYWLSIIDCLRSPIIYITKSKRKDNVIDFKNAIDNDLEKCIQLTHENYQPALCMLATIYLIKLGIEDCMPCLEKLIELKSLDYASQVINLMFSNHHIDRKCSHSKSNDFNNIINRFIETVSEGNNYKSDYEQTIKYIYDYLDDSSEIKVLCSELLKKE